MKVKKRKWTILASQTNSLKVKSQLLISKQTIVLSKMVVCFLDNNVEILQGTFNNELRKIIETYDGNGDGICESIEVAKWLVDCYRAMNKQFQPTATDIASYVQILDKNRNGKVSMVELEEFIVRYFFNPNRNWINSNDFKNCIFTFILSYKT